MNCPVCGTQLADAAVCPRCGHDPMKNRSEGTEPSPWVNPDTATPATPPEPPVPAFAFATPEQYASVHPQPEPAPAAPPAPRRRSRLLPILLLSLLVLLTGGGVAAAGYHLGWYGEDRSPADVVPASAVSYVQVELNPSLVQQAAAWQFLHDLPEVEAAVGAGDPDPRAIGWKLVQGVDDSPLGDVDYERDVKPWLGERLGVAVVPNGKRPAGLFVVEVTDEERAATTLRSWSTRADVAFDVTLRDGYALLTQPDDTGFLLGELDAGVLAKNATFTDDLALLGDPGVLAGWVDLAGITRLNETAADTPVQGRGVFALSFTADTMVLAGHVRGGETAATGTADLGDLPGTTVAAAGFAGGGAALEKAFPTLPAEATDWLTEAGLERADLVALLGRSLAVGVSWFGIDGTDPGDLPEVGVRIATDDIDRAKAALETLFARSPEASLHTRAVDDVLLVATSDSHLEELASGTSRLAGLADFTKAVPDHARAAASAWVDLHSALEQSGVDTGPYAGFVRSLRSLGGAYVADGPGSGSWSLRLVRS